jgi:hypothetical protein
VSFWTALVVVVAILAFTAIRIARYRLDHDGRMSMPPADDGAKAQISREVQELRERVRVLERIATDTNSTNAVESRQIAQEIEALRDGQG